MFIDRIRENNDGTAPTGKDEDCDGMKQAELSGTMTEKKSDDPTETDIAQIIREKALYYGVMALNGQLWEMR